MSAADVVGLVGSLVDKSLVQAEPVPGDGATGFSRPSASTPSTSWARGASWISLTPATPTPSTTWRFPSLPHHTSSAPRKPNGCPAWTLEHENLRTGLACLIDDPAGAGAALRFGVALRRFWFIPGITTKAPSYSKPPSTWPVPADLVWHGQLALLRLFRLGQLCIVEALIYSVTGSQPLQPGFEIAHLVVRQLVHQGYAPGP